MTWRGKQLQDLDKSDLYRISEAIEIGDTEAIDTAVKFVCAETRENGHGRARARFSRNLKHAALSRAQRDLLIQTVARRLTNGAFDQQFHDQLHLAMALNRDAVTTAAAHAVAHNSNEYVRRHAQWVIDHDT